MATNRINIQTNEDFELKSTLLYISESEYGVDWQSQPHIHPFAEIFYVTNGSGQFWIEDKTYPVNQDDVILINSNINHTELANRNGIFSYIVMGVSGINFDVLNRANFSIQNFNQYKHEILFYIKSILYEAKQKDSYYQIMVNKYLDILLLNIMRRAHNCSLSALNNQKLHLECSFVKQYIDKNYQQNITLDLLAKLTHTSKYYLSHEFKAYAGQSIIDYLLDKRIDEACSLMQTTNHSISTISSLVGYSSPSYFSSAFTKRMKQSPSNYRLTLRKDPPNETD